MIEPMFDTGQFIDRRRIVVSVLLGNLTKLSRLLGAENLEACIVIDVSAS